MRPVLGYYILSGGLDREAQLYADAVRTNGGQFSIPRLRIVSTFFKSEKNVGSYQLTDDYIPYWGEDATQGLTSLKQRRLGTVTAAPTFTADRGYAFNGTTQYGSPGFIPSTHAVAMTGSNMRLAVYERTNFNNNYSAGLFQSTNQNLILRARITGPVVSSNFNSAVADVALASSNSQGYTAASRTAAGVYEVYKNGVSLGTATPASSATTLPTIALLIGALNNAGTPAGFRGASIGLVVVGASLTAAQELAQYNAVQAWATAIGANV